jgi:hypothetical protein
MANRSIDSRKGHIVAGSFLVVAIGIASCSSSGTNVVPTDLTWNKDIGPMVQTHCGSCHYAGGAGHFDLLHYESAKSYAPSALSAMKSGRMPPWPPSSDCREYIGDRTLPADVIPKFDEWVAGGMPVGEGAVASFTPPVLEQIRPDLTAKMPEPYTPNESVTDDYRCFVLDLDFPTDTWIEGVDVTPSTPQVHHVLTYAMTGSALDAAIQADMNEAGPGYTCFGGPNPKGSGGGSGAGIAANGFPVQIGAWVPGSQAMPLPTGSAMLIPAGSRLIMQVHYNNLNGKPAPDQSSLIMQTRPTAPEFVYRTVPVAQPKLKIDADDPASEHSMTITHWGSSPTTLVGVAGHMHMLGKSIQGTITHANMAQECLLNIPDWNFQWQMQYRFPENNYAILQPGDSVKLDCIYDNSAQNQPIVNGAQQVSQDVAWGEGSLDEMCLMYLGMISPLAPPPAPPKTACESVATCAQACNPQSASCMLNCENLSASCLTCTIKGLVGCGAVSCGASIQAAQDCFAPCVMGVNAFGGSLATCLTGTCPNEWKAMTECLDPFLTDPKCTGALSGCGL